ncbi:hypothetical protein ABMA75_03870 [Halobacteriovorax sp. ZH4_bin.1]|uniref:phosphorylase family protein n=1 Tax=unclassified Halobacteriovorax TaxID=2639665 RepID=UPI00371886A8
MSVEFKEISKEEVEKYKSSITLLITTVTNEETDAVLCRLMPFKGETNLFKFHTATSIFYLGIFGVYGAVHVKSRQGSTGPNAIAAKVSEAISLWAPRAVIMPGIAFGVSSKSQKLGDIIVSEAVRDYVYGKVQDKFDNDKILGRIGNVFTQPRFYSRGRELSSGETLFSKFSAHGMTKKLNERLSGDLDYNIEYGLILSANILLNSNKKKKKLFYAYPDAIGGEMEGHSLASICKGRKIEWIVVKSICDWGDGSKTDEYHEICSNNSAELCLYVFSQLTAFSGIGLTVISKTSKSTISPTENTNFTSFVTADSLSSSRDVDVKKEERKFSSGKISRTSANENTSSLFSAMSSIVKDLDPTDMNNLFMVISEYIFNAFEHGQAEYIEFEIDENTLKIIDDGKHFDPLRSIDEILAESEGIDRGLNIPRGLGLKLIQEKVQFYRYLFKTKYTIENDKNTLYVRFGTKVFNVPTQMTVVLDPYNKNFDNFLLPDEVTKINIQIPKYHFFLSGIVRTIEKIIIQADGKFIEICLISEVVNNTSILENVVELFKSRDNVKVFLEKCD